MEKLVPVEIYSLMFFNALLLIVFGAAVKLYFFGYSINFRYKKEYASQILLVAVLLYMGLRPVSGEYFADMGVYYNNFMRYASGQELEVHNDYLWYAFMDWSSRFMSAKVFFFVCASLYIVPVYQAVRNWLVKDRFFLFLMVIASMSFWAYGTNGIRNGIATSIFLLGLSCYRNKLLQWGLIVCSYFVHGSMLIPIAAFVLTLIYNNPKAYVIGWLLSVPLSLILGERPELFFSSLGIGGERVSYLTLTGLEYKFSFTGFRWDFLLYSFVPVMAGYYFIVFRKFRDKLYTQVFNIYLTANAFWILIIRAAFSNRFAYLSWFLMSIVIFYPFFKQRFFRYQQLVLLSSMLVYYCFTYIMAMIEL